MKRIDKNLTNIFLLLTFQIQFSQLSKNNDSQLVAESEIYIDEITNIRYSDLIKLKFNKNVIRLPKEEITVELNQISDHKVKDYLVKLKKKHGNYEISKLVPEANWGDTLVLNRRSGELISIPDWSQVIKIRLANLVPIDSILNDLSNQSFVEYAEEPIQSYIMIEPNDNMFKRGNKWAFEQINADDAWEFTKGSSKIVVAIHDQFTNSIDDNLHEDLKGKVDYHFDKFGGHGIYVAGAQTNNEIGIASLGWNLRLKFYNQTYMVPEILRAVDAGVDVINFSWVWGTNYNFLRDAIKTALANGVMCCCRWKL